MKRVISFLIFLVRKSFFFYFRIFNENIFTDMATFSILSLLFHLLIIITNCELWHRIIKYSIFFAFFNYCSYKTYSLLIFLFFCDQYNFGINHILKIILPIRLIIIKWFFNCFNFTFYFLNLFFIISSHEICKILLFIVYAYLLANTILEIEANWYLNIFIKNIVLL